MDSPSINISVNEELVSNGKQALYESGVSIASQSSLVIERAIDQKAVTNTQKYLAGNSRYHVIHRSPPNHSLKLTESTACFFAARHKFTK